MNFFDPFWSNNCLWQTVTTYSQDKNISIQNGGSLLISVWKIILWSSLAIHRNAVKGRGIYIHSNDPREMLAFGNLCLACQVLPRFFFFFYICFGGEDYFVVVH